MTDSTSALEGAGTDVRDRLMWLFAVIAGALLVLFVVLVALLALFRPDTDTGEMIKALNTQIAVIVGAVLGYAARGPASQQGHAT